MRTLGRGPEERLRSDSVTGPLCPTSSSHLLVRSYGSIRGETGRPSDRESEVRLRDASLPMARPCGDGHVMLG